MVDRLSSAKRSHESEDEKVTTQPPTKRPRRDYNDTIAILVGRKEKCFTVHRDVICFRSKFFKAACSVNWKEGQEGIVRLPSVKPSDFEMYMDWVYFSEIAGKTINSRTELLINLYLLGDLVDNKTLRNKVVDALQTNAYKARRALDSVLLRLRGSFEDNVSQYPPESVQQIAVKLMQQTTTISAADFLAKTQEYQEADDEA